MNRGRRLENKAPTSSHRGFTLVEILVTIAIFSFMLLTVIGIATYLQRLARGNLGKDTAVAVAEEYIEVARNLSYDQVGTTTSLPAGPLPATFTTNRNGIPLFGKIVVKEMDDPADGDALGTVSGKPTDTAPADYKKVEVQVCIDQATCTKPIRLTTTIVPRTLETAANTGSLFITVLNANGQPVPLVTVTISNSAVAPAISNVSNTTDINGKLQWLSLPPSLNTYHITVTKSGYTTSGTITPSGGNPNPVQPDVSVILASVTSVTFTIDLGSTLTLSSLNQSDCLPLGSVTYHIRGQRLIGTSPAVYLVDQDVVVNGSGQATINNLAWDNYVISLVTSGFDVAGLSPPDAVVVSPGASVSASVVTLPHQSNTLRVIVRASGTNAPLAGAQVQVTDSGSYDQTKTTDQGVLEQTDWSGGSGQTTFTDPTRFLNQSGAPKTSVAGEVTIDTVTATPNLTESFTDNTNRDVTNTTADWNTTLGQVQLPPDLVLPGTYVTSAQAQSKKLNSTEGLITKVTVTPTAQANGQTITYAVAADGTTFETVTPGVEHDFAASGSDLRWRVTLQSADTSVTPTVDALSIAYTQFQRPTPTATITSSTYDSGIATKYVTLAWTPSGQPAQAGSTPVRFQVAANNDQSTWNYLGPDGTGSTYFTASNASIPSSLDNTRYFRYKMFLDTTSPLATPTISYIQVVKNNACTPPGQVFFSPMTAADYTIDVTLAGYQPASVDLTVTGQRTQTITLSP